MNVEQLVSHSKTKESILCVVWFHHMTAIAVGVQEVCINQRIIITDGCTPAEPNPDRIEHSADIIPKEELTNQFGKCCNSLQ